MNPELTPEEVKALLEDLDAATTDTEKIDLLTVLVKAMCEPLYALNSLP